MKSRSTRQEIPSIIIINPTSSPKYLSEKLKKYGINCIALFTALKEEIPPYFQAGPDLFDQQIYLDSPSSLDVVKEISRFNMIYIINGSDASTHLTDLVNQTLLPLTSNNPDTTHLRSNKYFTQETLKKKGLPHIEQKKFLTTDINRSIKNEIKFPCFCKPVNGLGSVGAFKAHHMDELLSHLNSAVRETLVDTSEYIIQEYVEGDELIIDTFSYKGKTFVSSVQRYHKQIVDQIPIYRSVELVRDQILWDRCVDFVKKCFDVVGFQNGFAHTEMFLTPENELKLIEINPRISGAKGYHNRLAKSQNLKSQIDILVECLRGNPKESRLSDAVGYSKVLFLFNFFRHPLKDPSELLSQYSSVAFYDLVNPIGHVSQAKEKRLTDLDLLVMLSNENLSVLKSDAAEIFSLEKSGKLL